MYKMGILLVLVPTFVSVFERQDVAKTMFIPCAIVVSDVQGRNSFSSSADVFFRVLAPRRHQNDVHTLRHRSIRCIFRGLSWAFFAGQTFELII